jgi:squalene-hopene/tetraprenyl-beta-curcumene cyclase
MAKALSLSGVDEVLDGDGNPVDWREELSIRLFDQQKENGFWINQSGRWWEKDPILVSCYAMLALERIYHAL